MNRKKRAYTQYSILFARDTSPMCGVFATDKIDLSQSPSFFLLTGAMKA